MVDLRMMFAVGGVAADAIDRYIDRLSVDTDVAYTRYIYIYIYIGQVSVDRSSIDQRTADISTKG